MPKKHKHRCQHCRQKLDPSVLLGLSDKIIVNSDKMDSFIVPATVSRIEVWIWGGGGGGVQGGGGGGSFSRWLLAVNPGRTITYSAQIGRGGIPMQDGGLTKLSLSGVNAIAAIEPRGNLIPVPIETVLPAPGGSTAEMNLGGEGGIFALGVKGQTGINSDFGIGGNGGDGAVNGGFGGKGGAEGQNGGNGQVPGGGGGGGGIGGSGGTGADGQIIFRWS